MLGLKKEMLGCVSEPGWEVFYSQTLRTAGSEWMAFLHRLKDIAENWHILGLWIT